MAVKNISQSFSLIMIIVITFLGISAVLHGYFNPPNLQIEDYDVGYLSNYKIGEVYYFEDADFYLVGMKDGNLRALIHPINQNCKLFFNSKKNANDIKINHFSLNEIFFDDCNNIWDVNGNSFSSNKVPLKTLFVKIKTSGKDSKVIVELMKSK